jgi:hypothetical protein
MPVKHRSSQAHALTFVLPHCQAHVRIYPRPDQIFLSENESAPHAAHIWMPYNLIENK